MNRFSKTRRISRALAVTHPPVRHACVAPGASICLGAKTALVRCQVAQGPHPRVRFFARGGGGGVGMVLRSASARLLASEACQSLICCDFLLSQATKNGFHRTPPLSTRTSAHRTARYLNATCHAAVLRLITPSRLSVRRSRGPLKGKNHRKPILCCWPSIWGDESATAIPTQQTIEEKRRRTLSR